MIDFAREEKEVGKIVSQLEHLEKTIDRQQLDLQESTLLLKRTQDAQEILQNLAQAVQQQAHQRISEVVSSCLQAVFGEEAYSFHIEFERKRGKTEAQLKFRRGGIDFDPLSSTGGGVVDVAAFALRIAAMLLHRPRLAKIVVLDESFKFVSEQYRENVRSMLIGLSKDMDIQIIQITHISELKTGEIIEL